MNLDSRGAITSVRIAPEPEGPEGPEFKSHIGPHEQFSRPLAQIERFIPHPLPQPFVPLGILAFEAIAIAFMQWLHYQDVVRPRRRRAVKSR